jgi:signal recognition particle subunit SRP54
VLDGKRKRRVAAGSGTKPEDINKLLKQHRDMADMMKMMKKNPGMMGKMAGALGLGGGGGGLGSLMGGAGAPSEADLRAMQKELAGLDPRALEQLPKEVRDALNNLPEAGKAPSKPSPSLPGLGGGLPGLGGPRLPGLGGPSLPKGPFPFGGGKKK